MPINLKKTLGRATALALIAACATPLAFAQPQSSAAARNDISPELLQVRRDLNDFPLNVLLFRNIEDVFQTFPVEAGGHPWKLASDERPLDFTYKYGGEAYQPEQFFDRTFTNAMIVVKNDKIVFERYRNLSKPSTHFLSMSMAKSITSIMVGAAIADGRIKSVDDQLVTYIPELKGTGYDGVSIRNTLLMRTGTDNEDVYDPNPNSSMGRSRERNMILNQARWTDNALTAKRVDAPGQTFRYATINTIVLGWLVEKAVGKPLDVYMSERLWKPLGAEAPGAWMADGPPGVGRAMSGMGFNATARDYARIGLMMLHNGKANGRQIIPESWVKESTVPTFPEPVSAEEGLGYQYQWWTVPDSNAYVAVGLQGQYIYVDPDTQTVIVKLSYFPLNRDQASEESLAFFRAVSAWKPK